MKFFSSITIVVLILILNSSLFAQKKDQVEVSPDLKTETVKKKCKDLKIGRVLFYPTPIYPEKAKLSGISGSVKVAIKVNEKGDVIEILQVEGNDSLKNVAVEAAKKATFSPTLCDGKVASIDGLITYNFVPFIINENYFVPESISDFADITEESNYYEAILFLTENYRLTFGYGDKNFHSNSPLSKGDFSQFLRLTLDFLQKRALIANKEPKQIGLFYPYNPHNIKSASEIKDINEKLPYLNSVQVLISKYGVSLVDENKKLNGKLPLTQNEVIDFWANIFGEDAVPVNFQKIKKGDKILTRGEFSLFLQESLYVLTYKVLP